MIGSTIFTGDDSFYFDDEENWGHGADVTYKYVVQRDTDNLIIQASMDDDHIISAWSEAFHDLDIHTDDFGNDVYSIEFAGQFKAGDEILFTLEVQDANGDGYVHARDIRLEDYFDIV